MAPLGARAASADGDSWLEQVLQLGKAEKRGIELDKGMLHGRVFRVTRVAGAASEGVSCIFAGIEVVVAPLIFLRRVFHFYVQPLEFVLKITGFVDRSLRGRIDLHDELAAVGPFAI